MLQHELLMLLAAPLLVIAHPLAALLWGLPYHWRRALGRWTRAQAIQRPWRVLTSPAAAWTLHAAALWSWHVPVLFQATLSSEWAHAAQHLSFFLSALLFWWSLLAGGYGAGVVSLFTTAIHTSILGALLTFSTVLWYPAYAGRTGAWGLTPIQDQQIGGLIMWVPAGIVYIVAGLGLFAAWIRQSDAMLSRRRYAD
jgi:putative membrane protein